MNGTEFVSIFFIALGLAADCFAVALGLSTRASGRFRLELIRTSLAFGFFQALMPVLGWLAGVTVVEYIESFDHWLAFGLLAVIGGRMIRESRQTGESGEENRNITGWLMLLTLSLATSIDALAVGLSFAFLKINIVYASLVIGLVSLVVTAIGFIVGRKAGRLLGKRAELIGGIILIAIGLRILLSHLF